LQYAQIVLSTGFKSGLLVGYKLGGMKSGVLVPLTLVNNDVPQGPIQLPVYAYCLVYRLLKLATW